MKSIAALLILCIFLNKGAASQNLTGNWSGRATQEQNEFNCTIEVNLNHVGNFLSGQMKTKFELGEVIQKFRGTFINGKIVMNEYEVIKDSSANLPWCLKNLEGFLSENLDKNTRTIEGKWTSHRSYQAPEYVEGYCPPGTFSMAQSLPSKPQTPKPMVVTRSVVSVKVLDKETNKPVSATMIVIGQRLGRQIIPRFEDGVYKFRILLNDTSLISIFADGYELLAESISTNKAKATETYYLTPKRQLISLVSDVTEKNTTVLPKPQLGEKITLGIRFEQSNAVVLPESKPELDRIVDCLTRYPTLEIELSGHTDNTGDLLKNQRLSNERVMMIKKYLVGHQIDPARITGKGFGSRKPVAPNNSEPNRKLNRRVEMRVVKE